MLLKFTFVVALAATLVVPSVTPTVTVEARDDSLSLNPFPKAIKARSQARGLPIPQLKCAATDQRQTGGCWSAVESSGEAVSYVSLSTHLENPHSNS